LQPVGVAVNPQRTKVYVANKGDNTVSVMQLVTNTVIHTIMVGTGPVAFGNFIGPNTNAPSPTIISTSTPSPSPTITPTSTPLPSPTITRMSTPSPSPTITSTSTPRVRQVAMGSDGCCVIGSQSAPDKNGAMLLLPILFARSLRWR